jgi:hypothetical protein
MTTLSRRKVHVARAWYLAVAFTLSGCIAPALMFSAQGQLLWALLKPMVGLDPNEVNLFEQPLIKGRMQSLLGPQYDTAVSMLKTANEIQQEGPLFYLVSRHSPVPELAEKAGFVWNAETNQMAVLLVSGGAPLVFAEQLNKQAEHVIPSWPKDLADYANPAALQQKALGAAAEQLSPALAPTLGSAANMAVDPKAAVKAQQEQLIDNAKAKLPPQLLESADVVSDPRRALDSHSANLTQQALSPLQQQLADVTLQVQQAQLAVSEAQANLDQCSKNMQQSVGTANAYTQAQQRYFAAQQQLLSAQQALEVARAKQKALAAANQQ